MALILDGTNGLSDVDGSAATPAIRGSDANTGVFFGTDVVGLSTGGSERVRVDASGNVGIGTSSPAEKLDVGGLVRSFVSGGSTRFVSTDGTVEARFGTFTTPIAYVGTQSNHPFAFYTNGTERARITSGAQFVVGDTATIGLHKAFIKQAAAEACLALQITGTDFANMVTFYNSGGTVKGSISSPSSSAVAYNTSSDYRLKENIAPMAGALAKVQQLKPCTYTWKDSGQAWEGFIAHEVAEVIPNAVTGEKDAVDADGNPQYQGIDTSFLVATLTAAIQEQQAIITALTARVEALEGAQA
jgi:hypothetical protein